MMWQSASAVLLPKLIASPDNAARMKRWSESDDPAGIAGLVEYRTDVFDAATIETLINRLQRVLTAMTAEEGDPS